MIQTLQVSKNEINKECFAQNRNTQFVLGRILNRFSKDIGAVDEILPKALLETLQIFLVGAGILIMAFIVTPWLIAPTIVITVMFYYTRKVYLASAQDVKRLEGTSTYAINRVVA